jgi:Holliday junction resolvase RusA-like endonuclease
MITLTIPGKPFAKQRPRATAFGGRARMYTPKGTVKFEGVVRDIGLQNFAAPIVGPVRVTIYATFKPAKSWPKKKTAEHLHRPHTQKPDLDNCIKALKDGLNRVAWADDSQVAEIIARKVWGITEQTIITVESM